MSSYAAEASDLAKLGSALVINSGTVTSESLENYVEAIQAYNAAERPVVLDPVGYWDPPPNIISGLYQVLGSW